MSEFLNEWARPVAYIVIFIWAKYVADTLHDIRQQLHLLNRKS